MKPEEIKTAESKDVHPKETIIGLDGLAIMLNPANPIDSLTIADLKRIYTGEAKNWKEFGGPDKDITVLSRESNSGTYVYFQEHVLSKADFGTSVLLMTSTAAIAQEIKSNPYAIGYGGVAYAISSKSKILSVKKDAESPAVFPSDEAVFSGSYPIARPLFLYTNGDPSGNTKSFIDFCLTPEGQKIVTETGYIAIVHE
jgi:phosphate transport system substrate-binding protein